LSCFSLPEQEKILGMAADRADIIIVGLVIMSEILNALRLKALTVVDAGILEGCVNDFLNSGEGE
jgi:exopolyphosphatase/pppGpp-phosphohydrolase